MISLQRKLALRAQASQIQGTARSIAALARTTQAAHSTVAVGDDDVSLVDTVQDARDSAELLPGLGDDTALAGDDAWAAWDQSEYAKGLAEQLDEELTTAQVELARALTEAEQALVEAGLARSDAALAVADAQTAVAEAGTALSEAITAAQTASDASVQAKLADGRLTMSDKAPVAADGVGKPVGAVWVRRVSGSIASMWEWTALGWVPRPLDEQIIPKVAIGEGTYGNLDGARIVANEGLLRNLYANRIVVSATDFAPGPGGYEAAWTLGNSASLSSNDSLDPSGRGIRISRDGSDEDRTAVGPRLPVNASTSVKVGLRGTFSGTSNTGEWRVEMRWFDRSGDPLPVSVVHQASANVTVENTVVAPTGTVSGQLALWVAARPSGSSGDRIFRTISARSMIGGELIVDGSILAQHLAALTVTAEKLAANAVTAVKIAADAVTAEKIMAGAVTTVKLDALAVTAAKIAAGAIIADKIAAGAITTAKLAATAIDGMTITGALIRTAPTGQRMQLDAGGLRAFNAAGSETAKLGAGTGGFDLSGWIRAGANDGFGSFESFIEPGYIRARGGEKIIVADATYVGEAKTEISKGEVTMSFSGTGPGGAVTRTVKISYNGIEYDGDTGWVDIIVRPGFAGQTPNRPQARVSQDQLYFRGGFTNTGISGSGDYYVGTIPASVRPRFGWAYMVGIGSSANSSLIWILRHTGELYLRNGTAPSNYFLFNQAPFWRDQL